MIYEKIFFGNGYHNKERPLTEEDFAALYGMIRGLEATGAERVCGALQYAYMRLQYLEDAEATRTAERKDSK